VINGSAKKEGRVLDYPYPVDQKRKYMTAALLKHYPYVGKSMMREDYDYVYLSPHCDDVAFSCAGTICAYQARGLQQLVVTLFAGDPRPPVPPLAQAYHQLWQIPEGVSPYQARRMEDEQAMLMLGIDYVWLDWPEVIYRAPDLSNFSQINDEQADLQHDPLFSTLCQWLVDLHAAYPSATVVVPLGVGGHRDHRIVVQAVLKSLDRGRLLFFEDFPYAAYLPEDTARLVQFYHLAPLEVDISDWLERRIQVASCYQSQHAMLFYPPSSYRDLIREYTSIGKQQCFIERYWVLADD
jgi:LmbE family N-acetylglucosaminyl deacetylase